jgi:hypothetical protein
VCGEKRIYIPNDLRAVAAGRFADVLNADIEKVPKVVVQVLLVDGALDARNE